jgi:hypothetical protein
VSSEKTHKAVPVGMVDELLAQLDQGVTEFRRYMASPEGREMRRRAAQFLIIASPLVFRLKFFRSTPLGRVLGVVGGAALVVKLAEALRDWEPDIDLNPFD